MQKFTSSPEELEKPRARAFTSMDERDAWLDAQYDFGAKSAGYRTMLGWADSHREALAEEFLDERKTLGGQLSEAFDLWLQRRVGHVEPSVRGVLFHEVLSHMSHDDGRPLRRAGRQTFKTAAEERKWLVAVRTAGKQKHGEGAEAYVERICAAAGAEIGPWPQSMPRV